MPSGEKWHWGHVPTELCRVYPSGWRGSRPWWEEQSPLKIGMTLWGEMPHHALHSPSVMELLCQETANLSTWAFPCYGSSVLSLLGVQATGSWADQPCFYTCSSSPNPAQIWWICWSSQSVMEHFKGESATARALMRRLSLKQLGHVSAQNTSLTFGEYSNYQSYSHRGILAPVFSSLLQWGC